MDIVVVFVTIVETLNFNFLCAFRSYAVADVYAVFHPVNREQVISTLFVALCFQTSLSSCCLNSICIRNVHGQSSQQVASRIELTGFAGVSEAQTTVLSIFLGVHNRLGQVRISITCYEAVCHLVAFRHLQDLTSNIRNLDRTNDTVGLDTVLQCYIQLNFFISRLAVNCTDFPNRTAFCRSLRSGGCGLALSGCGCACGSRRFCRANAVADNDLYDCLRRILRQRIGRSCLLAVDRSGHIFQCAACTLCILFSLYRCEISSGTQRNQVLVSITAADLYIVCTLFCTLRDNHIEGCEAKCHRIAGYKLCTVRTVSSDKAPGIVVVDIRYAVITVCVLYETSGGVARQFFNNCLFYIVCSNFSTLVDVAVSDVRNAVFVRQNFAFLCLLGLVRSLVCALVSQIIVYICIVLICKLNLVVAVGYQVSAEDLIAGDGSYDTVALCIGIAPALLALEHRSQAEYTIINGVYGRTVRHSNFVLCTLILCIENILIIDLVVNCTAVSESAALGGYPVQGYLVQIVVISPFIRVNENIQSLGDIASVNVVLAYLDLLYASSLFFQDKVIRCAAVCGLVLINRSRNRQRTERQCRDCHQSCNAEG